MGSLRFLTGRRWVLLALAVLVLSALAWRLGVWQFDRLDERRDRNAVVRTNEAAAPAPATDVLSPDDPPREGSEWRRVTATGSYAAEDTVVVRYRTRDGAPGVEVVTPLVLEGDGAGSPALLVDRGWFGTTTGTADPGTLPSPPQGEVSVTGYVRLDATGDGTGVTDGSTRAISSGDVAAAVERPLLRGFVQADGEAPVGDGLRAGELPDLTDGPHFFYGLQWWFFGLLALFGYGYLAYDEWRQLTGRRRPQRGGPTDAPSPALDASSDPEPEPSSLPETSSRNWVR